MKKELKETLSETVSTLRNLLFNLMVISEKKPKAISDLEMSVTQIKSWYEYGREMNYNVRAALSVIPSQYF